MRLGNIIGRLASISCLAGCLACSRPAHNAHYYGEHDAARTDMLKRCAVDQNSEDPLNCMAAQDAQVLVDLEASQRRR